MFQSPEGLTAYSQSSEGQDKSYLSEACCLPEEHLAYASKLLISGLLLEPLVGRIPQLKCL